MIFVLEKTLDFLVIHVLIWNPIHHTEVSMDYAEALVGLTQNIREYRRAVLKNESDKFRHHMEMIQHYTNKLGEATNKMESQDDKRITITIR